MFRCTRIELQQQRSSSGLVLYHFVGSAVSCNADPLIMIRRFTSQLLQVPTCTCTCGYCNLSSNYYSNSFGRSNDPYMTIVVEWVVK